MIWAAFLGLLYVLHEFFLIGFLTFLVCFIVRALVGFLARRISPHGASHGLDLTLTFSVLLGICLVLYGLGRYFVPPVIREGKSLVAQLQHTSAAELQNILLANTVGAWQFHRQFGTPPDQRYQTEFKKFQESGRNGEGLYRSFPQLEARMQADFEANYEHAQVLHLQSTDSTGSALPKESDSASQPEPLISPQEWSDFRKSSDYQSRFKEFYEQAHQEDPAAVPIDYSFFQRLSAAYPEGESAFQAAVRQHYSANPETIADQEHDFETATKLELAQRWWATSHVADWVRDHAKNDGPKVFESVVGWFDQALSHFVRVPIQVVTALVLSIFMLIEWPGMKRGMQDLRNTRLRPVFDEIVPSVVALGKLIGKTFQGQALIAAFNALLTLSAMWLIGVKYKFVLALAVFVFSFIPVVGVILSGLPICVVAVLQPGGSLLMVLQVVIAIAIIHMIEGTVLAPRIIGKIGHLHPVLVIVILLVAEHFFGMWGLILGVPVAIYIIRVMILQAPIPGIYDPDKAEAWSSNRL